MLEQEIIEKTSKNAPNFLARFYGKLAYKVRDSSGNIRSFDLPIRAYVHETGFFKAYSHDLGEAMNHLSFTIMLHNAVEQNPMNAIDSRFQYALAALWGHLNERMIDFIGFSDIDKSDEPKNWPGNPQMTPMIFKNGIYSPDSKVATCGDGLVMLGIEEKHRRGRKNLKDFIEHPPKILGLSVR